MKNTLMIRVGAVMLSTVLAFGAALMTVHAHGDEVHETITPSTDITKITDVAKLEQMVTLLNQIIMLMKMLRMEEAYTPAPKVVAEESAEMEVHHEEHAHDTTTVEDDTQVTETAKLVIEIEPHNGKTHAHVRYTDKPEEMFFVDSSIDNEDGVVADIHTRTGLSEAEVRSALKYLE